MWLWNARMEYAICRDLIFSLRVFYTFCIIYFVVLSSKSLSFVLMIYWYFWLSILQIILCCDYVNNWYSTSDWKPEHGQISTGYQQVSNIRWLKYTANVYVTFLLVIAGFIFTWMNEVTESIFASLGVDYGNIQNYVSRHLYTHPS